MKPCYRILSLILLTCLTLLLQSGCTPPRIARGPLTPSELAGRPEPKIFAHYMPWFRAETNESGMTEWEHWQWYGKGPKHDPDDILENGRHDIASVYYPKIGPYHGLDPDVLEYHLLTARVAGIDGFIADWYGPDTYSDEVFSALLQAAERYGMKAAICLEEKTFFSEYSSAQSRAEALDTAEGQMRYVIDTYGPSPAYLRHEGQPVFLIFNGYAQGALGLEVLTPEELKELLGRFSDSPVSYVRGHVDTNYETMVSGGYAWCGDPEYRDWFYRTARDFKERQTNFYSIGIASPGFDDRGVWGWGNGPRFTDRRDTQEYRDNWDEVLQYQPDAVQIATWNDFEEGTTIEPTEDYGFTYVDVTEEYANKFSGHPANPADNQWPWRIYQLRKAVRALPEAEQAYRTEQLDQFVDDFVREGQEGMDERLQVMEHELSLPLKAE